MKLIKIKFQADFKLEKSGNDWDKAKQAILNVDKTLNKKDIFVREINYVNEEGAVLKAYIPRSNLANIIDNDKLYLYDDKDVVDRDKFAQKLHDLIKNN